MKRLLNRAFNTLVRRKVMLEGDVTVDLTSDGRVAMLIHRGEGKPDRMTLDPDNAHRLGEALQQCALMASVQEIV